MPNIRCNDIIFTMSRHSFFCVFERVRTNYKNIILVLSDTFANANIKISFQLPKLIDE